MRPHAPFCADDLAELDEAFLSRAARVVAMEDVVAGDRGANVIGFRHDCDNFRSLATACDMAAWEADRGYRSTYFILHTAPYWQAQGFDDALEEIASHGHEIGIHVDALARAMVTGEDPDTILDAAIGYLRHLGHDIRGAAGHGNSICNRDAHEGEGWFANDEQFVECRRPDYGDADRVIVRGKNTLKLAPRSLADFGLEYEALFCALPFHFRFSDSGGRWIAPGFGETAERFHGQVDVAAAPENGYQPAQLHLLVHPDWWENAFVPLAVSQ